MKKYLYLSVTLAVLANPVFAQTFDNNDCNPEYQDCTSTGAVKEANKEIYPYRPYETAHIYDRIKALYEGTGYVSNIYEMEKMGLQSANTKIQPWGGSYWPLYQGGVGNTYQNKDYNTFIFSLIRNLDWKKNVKDYKERAEKVHPRIYDLSEDDLAKLSPSEKYDIMLGDTTFDLTNRVWDYAEKWGNEKIHGFLSAIEIPDGYRLPSANKLMALWEGICHGWAIAAGHTPRPEKTVTVVLPNGKKMPFYPNDIKALISLMWAHSTIQSNVIFEGNRCNKKSPDKDKHGRYIDVEKDKNDDVLTPRCADVHPAIFHVSLINLLGIEGRSFVVDKTAEAAIANQPVSGYEILFFNPKEGFLGPLSYSVIARKDYPKDPFAASRNPESTHIVGVEMKLKYIDWEFPKKQKTNGVADDKVREFFFTYDLELNAAGKIVGGQWRVSKRGGPGLAGKTHQPDFFWVVPRDWKNYFKPMTGLPKWDFENNSLPPKEFAPAARAAHSFVYEESKRFFPVSPKCIVVPINGGESKKVDCEYKYPRPQPLINVVETLLNESRKTQE